MIGVDYDLFWELNPKSLKPFIKAFDLRQEYDNSLAWMNGLYIRLAIGSSLSKETKYPKKPLSSFKRDEEEKMSADLIKAKMFRQMKVVNARFGKGDANEQ